MREIVFNNNKLQKESRVKIPNAIVDTLGLREGMPLSIVLDVQDECIVIRKNNKKEVFRRPRRRA